jgi:16S rRNA C967 or C1407 C5-methylase (RsmB/RsmF family)
MEIMAMKEESSGEQCNRRISPFLQVLQGHANFPPGILNLIGDLSSLGERSQARLAQVDRDWLTATIPRGQQTILLDEPEAGLGLMNQILLWGRILRDPAICERYQIILVSHSNQCLDFEHAHYVELRPGYLDACRQLAAGKLSFDEAARFASNMPQQLSTRELKLLREIRKQQGEFHKGKCVKTADRLEDLSLIHAYRSRRRIAERPKGREIWTATLPTNDTHCYEITSKGMQLLDMHQKDSL